MTQLNNQIIVALDHPDLKKVEELILNLKDLISYYKIGLELFSSCGWTAVDLVKKHGGRVFLDLKLHDIPNTVARTAAVICDHGVDMFNVHTLGGLEMMQRTAEAVASKVTAGYPPVVLGVTILTSHTRDSIAQVFDSEKPIEIQGHVVHLARMAKLAGLNGVVSSPLEIEKIREELGHDFVLVTPGIRPQGSAKNDQKRTLTPKQALDAGSNYLVIGRPITAAENPQKAAESILASL
ncbi:orotidine-5'-phosphate decarboxylase [Omnitrophica bacterium]|nr:orotidine-5'-phosphate decarboxylase [Candidatus Omnitrophota bacterium]